MIYEGLRRFLMIIFEISIVDHQTAKEKIVDHYYQEQQDNVLNTIILQQQMELEQLIQIAENLRNDIIKLHDQEQELIQRLNIMKTSETSLLHNIYSFLSNKNVLLLGMQKKKTINND
ncbi:unnamed protein product [Rotaria sp. Silwood1]|nr:unnamed protein product [Rotaria sp. Silwood1]